MRKIAIVTSTRAEYGLMYWLMREVNEDPDLILQLIVTGSHLSPEFGLTYRLIEQDGFDIAEKIEILLSSDSSVGVAKAMGLAVISFADVLTRLSPDILVVLGDRFEILAIAQTAMILKIPVAHLHGGEVTEGCLDDAIRHAITKLSHIHFPATESYQTRVLQLGENPSYVFNFGSPGLDHITKTRLFERSEITATLGIHFQKINFLVTYHPVTAKKKDSIIGLFELFKTLDLFPEVGVIFTRSNADEAGRQIGYEIDRYIQGKKHRWVFTALGLPLYLSLVKEVNLVLGNSSSGLIEVPLMKTPTVNIGNREQGRLLASSVVCCDENVESIKNAIEKALSQAFQTSLTNMTTPYYADDTSKKIKNKLKEIDLNNLIQKKFVDII